MIAELEAIEPRDPASPRKPAARCTSSTSAPGAACSLVAEARARGVDVSCETCPHYLVLTEDDLERLGAVAKCAPPLRPQAEQDALWALLSDGTLPMVASDHSPAPAEMKTGADFFADLGRHLRLPVHAAAAADRGPRQARAAPAAHRRR